MGTVKELLKTGALFFIVFLLFVLHAYVEQLPRWVGPVGILAYAANSAAKRARKLDRRIAWLEENTGRRKDS